jgi:hypothetical protein
MTDVYNTLDNNYTRLNKTLYISISVGAWAIQIEACCVMNFVSMHGWMQFMQQSAIRSMIHNFKP